MHPHYLSFFNQAVGGIRDGHRIGLDANYDWGQDLFLLRRWMRAEKIDEVDLLYFGKVDPAVYGIRYSVPNLRFWDILRPRFISPQMLDAECLFFSQALQGMRLG